MADHRYVVFQMTGSPRDGQWWSVPADWDGHVWTASTDFVARARRVQLVPSGAVEWRDDDRCAEVWVPPERLDAYRAEFMLDEP